MGRHGEWVRVTPRSCGTASRRWTRTPRTRPIARRAGRGPRADRRRRPPLPRRDLVAVGQHPRPPRARARRRHPRAARSRRALDHARERQLVVVELAEALAPRRARRRSALPVRVGRRGRSRTGTEDRVPVLGRTATSPGTRSSSRSGTPTTATPIGALSLGDGGFGTDLFDPLRFPVLRAPDFADPSCFETATAMVAAHAHELAAVIVEPLVQGAAGMQLADPDGLARARRRVPRARRAADLRRGRHRLRPHRHAVRFRAVRPAPRPARAGQGPHRRLPRRCRRRWRAARCSTRSSAPTSPSARCTTGTRTRGTRSPPRSRCATSSCSTRGRCSTTCASGREELQRTARRPRSRHTPRCARSACCGLMGGVELAAPAPTTALGTAGLRGGGRARRAAAAARRRRRAHAAAHRHVGGAAPHRARARRRARRGHDVRPGT